MSAVLSSQNLIAWLVQVSLIALCGTLLPVIQPWQHPLVIVTGQVSNAPVASSIAWATIIEWVIVVGALVRLCWLALGFWQARGLRRGSVPMSPIPESVRQARALTHADAAFRISPFVDGPATLGYVDPVILLPESFLSLSADAQLSIACHELLHVRRNDWLVTLVEELASVLFWFNPAMWWLFSQTKLSREQLVDCEVVGLTSKRAPYVEALLSMAVTKNTLDSVPAAAFFAESHLAKRVRTLLTPFRVSTVRLLASYISIACLLAVAG